MKIENFEKIFLKKELRGFALNNREIFLWTLTFIKIRSIEKSPESWKKKKILAKSRR